MLLIFSLPFPFYVSCWRVVKVEASSTCWTVEVMPIWQTSWARLPSMWRPRWVMWQLLLSCWRGTPGLMPWKQYVHALSFNSQMFILCCFSSRTVWLPCTSELWMVIVTWCPLSLLMGLISTPRMDKDGRSNIWKLLWMQWWIVQYVYLYLPYYYVLSSLFDLYMCTCGIHIFTFFLLCICSTCLMIAASEGSADLVRLLAENKADPMITDSNFLKALDYAVTRNHQE